MVGCTAVTDTYFPEALAAAGESEKRYQRGGPRVFGHHPKLGSGEAGQQVGEQQEHVGGSDVHRHQSSGRGGVRVVE